MSPVLILNVGTLLLIACWTDLTSYRIPNWIPGSIVLLFVAFVLWSRMPPAEILWHIAAFGAVLIGGMALFARGLLGGGDAKLLAAVSLWMGWCGSLLDLFLLTGVYGGLLSLAILFCRASNVGGLAGSFLRAHGWEFAVFDPTKKIAPYALAISAAFFSVAS